MDFSISKLSNTEEKRYNSFNSLRNNINQDNKNFENKSVQKASNNPTPSRGHFSSRNNDLDNNKEHKEKSHLKKYIKKKIIEIVKYILDKKYYPATLFVFNIRKIEDYSKKKGQYLNCKDYKLFIFLNC